MHRDKAVMRSECALSVQDAQHAVMRAECVLIAQYCARALSAQYCARKLMCGCSWPGVMNGKCHYLSLNPALQLKRKKEEMRTNMHHQVQTTGPSHLVQHSQQN